MKIFRFANLCLGIAFFLLLPLARATDPVVSNISAVQRAGTKLVDITYDVTADTSTVAVTLAISSNGSTTSREAPVPVTQSGVRAMVAGQFLAVTMPWLNPMACAISSCVFAAYFILAITSRFYAQGHRHLLLTVSLLRNQNERNISLCLG